MKKYTVLTLITGIAACVALCVFSIYGVNISADETANTLINDCIGRGVAAVAIAVIILLCGYKNAFIYKRKNYGKALLWCIPCLLVSVANFPFYALISGAATIDRYGILWLFILDCILIALMEEMLFRGLLLSILNEVIKNKPLVAVIAESAIFALCHLFNLLSGAAIGETLLQVGYTFLTGLMFSFVYVKTGNIWASVVLHAVFDVGGKIVYTLGSGTFQDTVFWVLTAVCAVICTVHIVITLYKKRLFEDK
ncbi:MAG: CPBP family intramembrane metalloprotease [Clostridia bacterium]|nr:CPBP family intramembrane metalloprotease [Clostridia bacterium]